MYTIHWEEGPIVYNNHFEWEIHMITNQKVYSVLYSSHYHTIRLFFLVCKCGTRIVISHQSLSNQSPQTLTAKSNVTISCIRYRHMDITLVPSRSRLTKNKVTMRSLTENWPTGYLTKNSNSAFWLFPYALLKGRLGAANILHHCRQRSLCVHTYIYTYIYTYIHRGIHTYI